MYHFVQKYGLGYLLGDFFTNSSGHPENRQSIRKKMKIFTSVFLSLESEIKFKHFMSCGHFAQ
jgi:hypothetical protein